MLNALVFQTPMLSMGLRKNSAIGLHEQKYDSWNEGGDRLGVRGISQMSPESSTWL